jgi:hypothetical protein
MTTEEFYAHALLAAFRSQETNNLLSAPKQNEVVSLANEEQISKLEMNRPTIWNEMLVGIRDRSTKAWGRKFRAHQK